MPPKPTPMKRPRRDGWSDVAKERRRLDCFVGGANGSVEDAVPPTSLGIREIRRPRRVDVAAHSDYTGAFAEASAKDGKLLTTRQKVNAHAGRTHCTAAMDRDAREAHRCSNLQMITSSASATDVTSSITRGREAEPLFDLHHYLHKTKAADLALPQSELLGYDRESSPRRARRSQRAGTRATPQAA